MWRVVTRAKRTGRFIGQKEDFCTLAGGRATLGINLDGFHYQVAGVAWF